VVSKRPVPSRYGTNGSNPSPSSGESPRTIGSTRTWETDVRVKLESVHLE